MSLARGTRQYRVTVSHTTATSATSEPIYVTWDALDIWGDLSTALTTAVTGHSDYTSKQTALLTCMNAGVAADDQYGSFDDILADYANAKAKLEGACSSQSSQMFATSQRVVQAKLNALRNGNTDYDGILGTPQGERFKAIAGNAAEIKRLLNLATGVGTPTNLEFPVYEQVQARSSPRSEPERQPLTAADVVMGSGLACLPDDVIGADLTLTNKLRVLNCLVFDTPHEFWVDDVGSLKSEARSGGRFAWLLHNTDIDWVCTSPSDFQGPVASCLKHDVAYSGLQVITGTDAPRADGNVLDEAWNPRNKALADYRFKADITAYGCQNQPLGAWLTCGLLTNATLAGIMFWAVAEVNDKGWPVTPADIRHFKANEEFTVCAEPVVPKVEIASVQKAGYSINATWSYRQGCAPIGPTQVTFPVYWVTPNPGRPVSFVSGPDSCTIQGHSISCTYDFPNMPPGHAIVGVDAFVIPDAVEYGRADYGGIGNRGRRYTQSHGPFDF